MPESFPSRNFAVSRSSVRLDRGAGAVCLVGAGAGEAGLLTLAAREALEKADVVLFDDLVDRTVLDLIPASAARIAVGKRAGRASTPQSEIIATMISASRTGKSVVRLKGGDPLIFGRGGEEAQALADAGIEVHIVPGMTAALAAAAAAGIPLTHRGVSTAVSFVTASTRDGAPPNLAGLAGKGRTLVIYMGRDASDAIVGALQQDHVPGAMPVAVIENAGRRHQRLGLTDLRSLAGTIERMAPTGPTLLIVGEVVAARVAFSSNAVAARQAEPATPAKQIRIPVYAPVADFHFAHG
ncbi:MAG: uroporphyrinogen-III C-methyltransferase [Rhodobacteraceae bacterium]|nr:uroporphyrinogen-III C-methyltransferase [Paracoccaceae bacterium]